MADRRITVTSLTAQKTGSAPICGLATLVAGAATVATTAVVSGDVIQLTRQASGGTLGHLNYGSIISGTSFVIGSSSGTETSTIAWTIVHGI